MRPLLLSLAIVLLSPAAAAADGLPVGGIDVGPLGVAAGGVRHVALDAREGTIVARIEEKGGRVRDWLHIPGRFTVPAVAQDGTADGLSADGRTLVLIRPRARFPQSSTRLAIFETGRRFRARGELRLKGDYSFDALSPDGRTLFLIHYISRRDPTKYRVRSYDLRARRLHPEPIVDPNEPPDEMNGLPISRVTSPDGRFAYTLYGGAEHPFIHALDTVERTARCIDLDDVHAAAPGLTTMKVGAGGRSLTVAHEGEAVAHVDTATYEVRAPAVRPYRPPAAEQEDEDWEILVAPVGLLIAAGALTARARRRPAPRTERG